MIDKTAVIDKNAKIGKDVKIGPFCTVGPDAELKDGVELVSHVVVSGKTTIGENTRVFPFAVVGINPQHLRHMDDAGTLIVGKNNIIRENATIHVGTSVDQMMTTVGDNNLIMVGAHIAHDCRIGNNAILTNNATLAGHVHIGDFAVIGGLSAIHQWCRIGKHAMVGGCTGVEKDVIPYGTVTGNRAHLAGLNLVGLKRRNFPREEINALRHAYKDLFGKTALTFAERVVRVEAEYASSACVKDVIDFLKAETDRAFCQPADPNSVNTEE